MTDSQQNDNTDNLPTASPEVNPFAGQYGSALPAPAPKVEAKAAPKKVASPKTTPDQKPAPPAGSLVTIVTRNEFYRDGFRSLMRLAIAEAIIIVALVLSFIVYMNSTQTKDRYFATTADGRIMQLVPLDRANMGTAAVLSWASQSATEVMTFSFKDYQRRLQESSRHFTRRGWETFTDALQKSGVIESVEALRQVVSAEVRSAPILTRQGVFEGKYRWLITLPLAVTYTSGTSSRTDNLDINVTVERVPSLENPNGVGIQQWVADLAPSR